MAWRWRLGELFGIVVYMHVTFLLLIAWAAFAGYQQPGGWAGALMGILVILLVFACVVAHEYGHALTARRYGIKTRDITLLPIGGVARLERMPRDPRQELVVALAGPAVNVVIAAVLYLFITLFHSGGAMREPVTGLNLWDALLRVNVVMIVFNLLPAFPMDGGRVLRALLAQRMEYSRATRTAASVGQMMAFLFGFYGLTRGEPMLLLVALFVYMGAEAEAQAEQIQTAFSGHPARRAMLTRFVTLGADDTLSRAVQVLLSGSQQDFPVIVEDGSVGLLTRRDLLSSLHELGPTALVRQAMRMDVAPVEMNAPLEEVFQRLQSEELPAAPVVDMGRLAGLITMENIAEFLMVHAALEGSQPSAGRGVQQEAAEREWVNEPGARSGAWRQRGSL
jgi:Zn-dependent protease/CBS domain-containing protein